jgi:glycerol-3-phosphate O-acyltransferase
MNIVLVPVMVSYDRLFEANYVAEGIFEGTKHPESSITQLSRRVLMPQANSLGNVFVKYLEPIQLKDYVQREVNLNLE